MLVVVGIDEGGIYSRAAMLSMPDLDIISFAIGESVNYHNIGLYKVRENLERLLYKLCENIESKIDIKHVTICLPALK